MFKFRFCYVRVASCCSGHWFRHFIHMISYGFLLTWNFINIKKQFTEGKMNLHCELYTGSAYIKIVGIINIHIKNYSPF